MKKLLIPLIIIAALLCFAACKESSQTVLSPSEAPTELTEAPTEEPTEAPTEAPTEEPTAEPTEEPTEAPTPEPTATPEPTPMPTEVPVVLSPRPEGDYFAEIRADLPFIADLDGDGQDDVAMISAEEDEEGWARYSVSITRAADPENTFEYDAGYGFRFVGAVLDLDPSDAGKEIVFCTDDEGDSTTFAVRFKDDGSGFEVFDKRMESFDTMAMFHGIAEDYVFNASEGIWTCRRTEILGTHFVGGRYTVTANGFEFLNEEYTYEENAEALKLRRDIKLKTEKGKKITVKKGEKITPVSTDLETYVKVKLKDGTICICDVTFGDPEHHMPVFINGIQQDDLARIPYAG